MLSVNTFIHDLFQVKISTKILLKLVHEFKIQKYGEGDNLVKEEKVPNLQRGVFISSSVNTFLGKFVIKQNGVEPSVRFICTNKRTAANSSLGLNV